MKSSKKLFGKSLFSRSRVITLVVFVLAFGGYGVYKLASSHAATCVNYTFRYGSKGSCVSNIQGMLNWDLGNTTIAGSYLTVDGSFGTNTKNAVIKLQKAKGLSADGIVGSNTWKALCQGKIAGPPPSWFTLYSIASGCPK